MSNNVVVLDAGNSEIKFKSAGGEGDFVHAFKKLTDTDYEQAVKRSGAQSLDGYYRINGDSYVVGESAARHVRGSRQYVGAARYRKDYYGVFVATSLAKLYRQSGSVTLFASCAPKDIEYRRDLIEAARGTYHVETPERELRFDVTDVYIFDEPVGGLMNVMLNDDGRTYANSALSRGDVLVIDIGGVTTDFIGMHNETVDYAGATSRMVGVKQIERDFYNSLYAMFSQQLKTTSSIQMERIRRFMVSGKADIGGEPYPCDGLVEEATNMVTDEIAQAYQDVAGGSGRWDAIVLTGGGSALLYDRLFNEVLNHKRVYLAENDFDKVHLANVRGGLKYWRASGLDGG